MSPAQMNAGSQRPSRRRAALTRAAQVRRRSGALPGAGKGGRYVRGASQLGNAPQEAAEIAAPCAQLPNLLIQRADRGGAFGVAAVKGKVGLIQTANRVA